MSSKTSPESRNATAACPSGICGAIHGTLTPEQCNCRDCKRYFEQLASSQPKTDLVRPIILYFWSP